MGLIGFIISVKWVINSNAMDIFSLGNRTPSTAFVS